MSKYTEYYLAAEMEKLRQKTTGDKTRPPRVDMDEEYPLPTGCGSNAAARVAQNPDDLVEGSGERNYKRFRRYPTTRKVR